MEPAVVIALGTCQAWRRCERAWRKGVEQRRGAKAWRESVGHLVTRGLCHVARTQRHAQRTRRHLADLGVQPLAHLGAAVRDEDGAVGVDVHERAALVHITGGISERGRSEGEMQRSHACTQKLWLWWWLHAHLVHKLGTEGDAVLGRDEG